MIKLRMLIILLLTAVLFAGCSNSNEPSKGKTTGSKDGKLQIHATLYPIQYALERIGGDTVSVHSVYPPGADAHTYEPSSKEMVSIAKSDAFFYLGADMEPFSKSVAQSLASQNVRLIEIGKHKDLFIKDAHDHNHDDENHEHAADEHDAHKDHDEHDEHEDVPEHADEHHEEDHHHGDLDPHIWLDPVRMGEVAGIIKDELITINPEAKEMYEKNFSSLNDDLKSLDADYNSTLKDKKNKHILVSHAAFGYWEDRYGIEQVAINGLSPSNEPSQKQLANIVKQTKKYDLNYILFEQNITNRVSEIIQDEIGAKSAYIHNLEVLTEEDTNENANYLSLMKRNLKTLDKVMK